MHCPNPSATRERIMDAAGELFAEQGFHHTSIRDICSHANVNIAAVNYHFRDKEGLYEAILLRAFEQVTELYPIVETQGTPEERLRDFVRMLLLRLLGCGRPTWHGRLMAAEMANPTGALDKLVEQTIRPTYEILQGIVRDLLGPATEEDIQLVSASVLGQLLYYRHAKPVIERLGTFAPNDEESVEALARHVTEFSLAGAAAWRARNESRQQ